LDVAPEPVSLPGPFKVQMHLQHMVNQMPLKDVTARVCRKLDVNCENPESTELSNENGDVTVTIVKGFTGYVALNRDGLTPTLYFINPTADRDLELGNVQMAEPAVVSGLTTRAGAAQRQDRGLILFSAYNCDRSTSPGIRFSSKDSDDDTVTFYSSGGLPSSTGSETEMSGFGGFINAPVGIFSIEGQRSSDGRVVGRVSVLLKAGELTITRLVPATGLGP
jgi:hypothetical protein